jgi:hypothetical protein
MIAYDGPALLDVLYIKLKGRKNPWNVALCEVLDGKLEEHDADYIALEKEVDGKARLIRLKKPEVLAKLNEELAPHKVEDYAVLREGETGNPHLTMFLEKYT